MLGPPSRTPLCTNTRSTSLHRLSITVVEHSAQTNQRTAADHELDGLSGGSLHSASADPELRRLHPPDRSHSTARQRGQSNRAGGLRLARHHRLPHAGRDVRRTCEVAPERIHAACEGGPTSTQFACTHNGKRYVTGAVCSAARVGATCRSRIFTQPSEDRNGAGR